MTNSTNRYRLSVSILGCALSVSAIVRVSPAAAAQLAGAPDPSPPIGQCIAPATPGSAPPGATATREQMRAYRDGLEQYLADADKQVACLGQVQTTASLTSRTALIRQVHAIVDNFNAQARVFEARTQAEALQGQQARQQQLQAFAAQVYAACKPPNAPPDPGAALSSDRADSYRQQLIGYQSTVRSYLACLRQANLAARAPGLASDQSAQLDHTGTQLGDAAIQSFNQVVARFNGHAPSPRPQPAAAETQKGLAEVVVQGEAIFPDSKWSVPAPLPTDECFSITRVGQTYRARLCQSSYVAPVDATTQLARTMGSGGGLLAEMGSNGGINLPGDAGLERATVQERIMAIHGVAGDPRGGPPIMGIAVAPKSDASQQVGLAQQTISYSINKLQIAGRHLSLTIAWRSDRATGSDDSNMMHFDLVLSPDNQTLNGYCSMGQQQGRQCMVHLMGSGPENSRH